MAGNFDTLPLDKFDKTMLQDAYDTITDLGLWDWIRRPDIPGEGGFMFSAHPEIAKISDAMKFQGHSGASFGLTMRTMEFIAKNGWVSYVESLTPRKFRIAWRMPNGYTDHGEAMFDSRAKAEGFIECQKIRDAMEGHSIAYWVEGV